MNLSSFIRIMSRKVIHAFLVQLVALDNSTE